MDSLDKNILLDLNNYCRITFQEMAEKYTISSNAIKKRFQKLVSSGVIEGFFIELSLAMVDNEFSMNLVTTDGSENEEFIEKIGNNPFVSYIGKLSGGVYNVFSCYVGASGLSELGTFLRGFPQVTDVEIFPLLYPRGEKIDLSLLHLKVIHHLIDDTRASISEIATKSGLTARMVSKVINELKNGKGVHFGIYLNPAAGGTVAMYRIHWDDKKTNLNEILSYLQTKFPLEFLAPIITATNPILFGSFIISDLKRVQEIDKELRINPKITKVITYLGEPAKIFPDIKTIRLREILAEAGLLD